MAAGGAFGGSRGVKPVPPEKGVFPLDHFHECKPAMQEYMACLRKNQMVADRCKQLSKKYLECRMERNLMCKQDLAELGFTKNDDTSYSRGDDDSSTDYSSGGLFAYMNQPRREQDHIAGLRRKRGEDPPRQE